jgi:hypothetical protein
MSRIKAKKVLKLVENGNKSISAAMRAIGYSPAYSKHPEKLVRTKNWQALCKEYIPEEEIAQAHRDELKADIVRRHTFPKKSGRKIVNLSDDDVRIIIETMRACKLLYVNREDGRVQAVYLAPDQLSRDKAIEKAYKLYGKYSSEKITITDRRYKDYTPEDIVKRKIAIERKLKKED